jgi:hypothetical protein
MKRYIPNVVATAVILTTLAGCGHGQQTRERMALLNREKAKIGGVIDSLAHERQNLTKEKAAHDSTFWAIAAQADREIALVKSGKATEKEKMGASINGQLYYPYALRQEFMEGQLLNSDISKIEQKMAKLESEKDSIEVSLQSEKGKVAGGLLLILVPVGIAVAYAISSLKAKFGKKTEEQ